MRRVLEFAGSMSLELIPLMRKVPPPIYCAPSGTGAGKSYKQDACPLLPPGISHTNRLSFPPAGTTKTFATEVRNHFRTTV